MERITFGPKSRFVKSESIVVHDNDRLILDSPVRDMSRRGVKTLIGKQGSWQGKSKNRLCDEIDLVESDCNKIKRRRKQRARSLIM